MPRLSTPKYNGRHLPPFFKGEWEALDTQEAKSIWRAVSSDEKLLAALKAHDKQAFIEPDHIDGQTIFLKPLGLDVFILDFELLKDGDAIALPLMESDRGIGFEPHGFFFRHERSGIYFPDEIDEGMDYALSDILIHNISHLEHYMRFHVSNPIYGNRHRRNIIVESVEDLADWYDISALDPNLLECLKDDIEAFEVDYNSGKDCYRRHVAYCANVISSDGWYECISDSLDRKGWRSDFSDPDPSCDDDSGRLRLDLSQCRQKISTGVFRYYL